MKNICDIALKNLPPPTSHGDFVEFIVCLGGWKLLPQPTLSSRIECLLCSGKEHITVYANNPPDKRKLWVCLNPKCNSNSKENLPSSSPKTQIPTRAISWSDWCQQMELGDEIEDIRFEMLTQSPRKIDFLLSFALKPYKNVIMRGDKGTGKTFSALATCELFTRKSSSCIFISQKNLTRRWHENFSLDVKDKFLLQISRASLLVIDDFGTAEMTSSFLSFFMDIISDRMQWKEKGTILTTNLKDEDFIKYCGDSLSDRLFVGQTLQFDGPSKRHKQPI